MSASGIAGLLHTKLQTHGDERGNFREIFRQRSFPETFVQANHSRSRQGVLRGLHYHRHQADLWYVVAGRAQVGLTDLRSRGEVASEIIELSADDASTLYIPPGVAHGFLALEDLDLIYAVTAEYDASDEYGVAWDDPALDIRWQSDSPILSARDAANPRLDWSRIPSFS